MLLLFSSCHSLLLRKLFGEVASQLHIHSNYQNAIPISCQASATQQQERDVRRAALTWTRTGEYFACFGNTTISKGSKTLAHLVTGKKKQLPLSIAALHTEQGDTGQDEDFAVESHLQTALTTASKNVESCCSCRPSLRGLSRRTWMQPLHLLTPDSNWFIWWQTLHSHKTSFCSSPWIQQWNQQDAFSMLLPVTILSRQLLRELVYAHLSAVVWLTSTLKHAQEKKAPEQCSTKLLQSQRQMGWAAAGQALVISNCRCSRKGCKQHWGWISDFQTSFIAISSASLPCYWLIYSRLKNSKAYGIYQPGQKEESSFTELIALYRLVKGASITPHAKHNVQPHLTFKVIFLFSALIYQGPPSPTQKRQASRALVMLFMNYNVFNRQGLEKKDVKERVKCPSDKSRF